VAVEKMLVTNNEVFQTEGWKNWYYAKHTATSQRCSVGSMVRHACPLNQWQCLMRTSSKGWTPSFRPSEV